MKLCGALQATALLPVSLLAAQRGTDTICPRAAALYCFSVCSRWDLNARAFRLRCMWASVHMFPLKLWLQPLTEKLITKRVRGLIGKAAGFVEGWGQSLSRRPHSRVGLFSPRAKLQVLKQHSSVAGLHCLEVKQPEDWLTAAKPVVRL